MKPTSLLLICLLLSMSASASVARQEAHNTARPNVIFLMADDLGYGDVGFNGNDVVKTPNLDDMAAGGVRFARFYSIGPICSPTRASCQTGRHYMRFGMMNVNVGKLPKQEINLPRIAKSKGYATGHFGKWHLGTMSKTHTQVRQGRAAEGYGPPWERSYDQTFTTETNVATWDPKDYTGLRIPKHSCTFWSNGNIVEGDFKGSSEKIIMQRAIAFISESVKANKPFLTTIWFYGPHSPVRAGKQLRDLYPDLPLGKQHYYGAITSIDLEVGRLRDTLKDMGVLDNTLIFFCSDNGPEGDGNPPAEYSPYQGAFHGSAGNFRGRKRYLYNGGVCVPAFAHWPAVIKPNQTSNEPVCVLDYVPTLNAITGYQMPDSRPLDGQSILPLLKGDRNWKRSKFIPFATRLMRIYPEVAMIKDGYKYCGWWRTQKPRHELYNIHADPAEQNNLINQQRDRAMKMRDEYAAWLDTCRKSFQGGDYPEPYQPQGEILPKLPESPGSAE